MNRKFKNMLSDLSNEFDIWFEYIATSNGIFKPMGDGAKAQFVDEFEDVSESLVRKIRNIKKSVVNYIYKD